MSCGQPCVVLDGTVGWTVFEAERPAQTASHTIRQNATLVIPRFCRLWPDASQRRSEADSDVRLNARWQRS